LKIAVFWDVGHTINDRDCAPYIQFLSVIPNVNNLVFSRLVCVKIEEYDSE
jgi:hypothetical protein